MMNITFQIFHLLDLYQICVKARYIPGKYNGHADHLSRYRLPPEWNLLPVCTEKIFRKFGVPSMQLPIMCLWTKTTTKPCSTMPFHINGTTAWHISSTFSDPQSINSPQLGTGDVLVSSPTLEPRLLEIRSQVQSAGRTIHNSESGASLERHGLPPHKIQDMTLGVWKCGGGRMT